MQEKRKWNSLNAYDIFNEAQAEIPWLVRPYIARGEIHVLIGDGSAGKSYVLLDMALGLVLGETVLTGLETGEPCTVVYLDQDSGGIQTRQRIKMLSAGRMDKANDLLRNLHLVDDEALMLDRGNDTREALASLVNQFKPDVLIFDAFRAFHSGDENSSGDIGKIFRHILRPLARGAGIAIIVAHHTTKPSRNSAGDLIQRSAGEASRGSTEIRNGADTTILLEARKSIRFLDIDKSRNLFDGEKLEPLAFTADRADGAVRFFSASGTLGDATTQAKREIIEVLSKGERISGELMAVLPGVSLGLYGERTARNALRELAQSGEVQGRPDGRRVIYFIPDTITSATG